jgi:hypothetical protein
MCFPDTSKTRLEETSFWKESCFNRVRTVLIPRVNLAAVPINYPHLCDNGL